MKGCITCKKEFKPRQTNLKKRSCNFCSLKCYWISLKGRQLTKVHKNNISNSLKGITTWNKGISCPLAESTKKAISIANKGKIRARGELANNWRGGFIQRNYKNIPGSHTKQEWELLKKEFNYMCLCCKRQEPEIKLSKDHILPISKNGNNSIKNIQPLCRSCNSRKHDKYVDFISNYQFNNIKI